MGCTISKGKVVPVANLQRSVNETGRPNTIENMILRGQNGILTSKDIITSDERTDNEPVKFYASNRTTISHLKMTGEVTGYVEYIPDNVLEVETVMKDYIDLLMNPHANIKPRMRTIALLH